MQKLHLQANGFFSNANNSFFKLAHLIFKLNFFKLARNLNFLNKLTSATVWVDKGLQRKHANAVTNVHFKCNVIWYVQSDGLAMGASLPVILANVYETVSGITPKIRAVKIS